MPSSACADAAEVHRLADAAAPGRRSTSMWCAERRTCVGVVQPPAGGVEAERDAAGLEDDVRLLVGARGARRRGGCRCASRKASVSARPASPRSRQWLFAVARAENVLPPSGRRNDVTRAGSEL